MDGLPLFDSPQYPLVICDEISTKRNVIEGGGFRTKFFARTERQRTQKPPEKPTKDGLRGAAPGGGAAQRPSRNKFWSMAKLEKE